MRTRRRIRQWLAVVIGIPAVIAVTPVSPAEAVPPSLLPLNVTNNSGRSDAVFLYVLGVNLSTGRLGYVNAAGTFTPWSGGTIPPSPAPDVSIAGPANGTTRTIQIPLNLSGRMYMSFGERLRFFLTPDGLVQPAPWVPSDPNRNILFDWSEFTYNPSGLWLNSSQVDMFSVPHAVAVTNAAGATKQTGVLVSDGRNRILNALRDQPGDWGRLVYTRADGTRLRAIAPRLGIEAGIFSPTYLDGYINQVWTTYQSTTLTVVPFQHDPNTRYFGRVSGTAMNFTNSSGAQVASFQKPLTKDVFGCDGRLHAPNDLVVGPIARSLCAAFHRSTLGFIHTAPTYDPSQFYTRTITDHYSKAMHANAIDGKAYGFAFDDVGGFESLVHDADPRSARVTLTPFGAGTPPPPPPPSRFEAENAAISQGVVESNHTGYSGTGFVNYHNVVDSYVEWTVQAAQAGSKTLRFRYANGTTANRPMDIRVNGALVADDMAFTGTGAWSTWRTVSVTATLNAGTNRIRATATVTAGGPNVDYLELA